LLPKVSKIATFLLENGTELNQTRHNGRTALDIAKAGLEEHKESDEKLPALFQDVILTLF
jgi:hypothetical protein